MKFIASGKVKDIYAINHDVLLFRFSDRVSAYDVAFEQTIPRKGEILCRFAEFWFENLNVPNHFLDKRSTTEITVRRMQMLPIECVVRGYFYGSLVDRWQQGTARLPEGTDTTLAARLPEPLFDPTTKSEHDVAVSRQTTIGSGLLTNHQYDQLERMSVDIYERMARIADDAGFILADLKLEFGLLDGQITLGDSIGPDEYRLWPKDSFETGRIQEAYDKQILRDWLAAHGFKAQFEEARAAGLKPTAPEIPPDIIKKMTDRYLLAYERFSQAEF